MKLVFIFLQLQVPDRVTCLCNQWGTSCCTLEGVVSFLGYLSCLVFTHPVLLKSQWAEEQAVVKGQAPLLANSPSGLLPLLDSEPLGAQAMRHMYVLFPSSSKFLPQ